MNSPISTIMTTDLITLSPTNSVGNARKIFRENHFHHIPVISRDGVLEGVVSTFDLLKLDSNSVNIGNTLIGDIMTTKLAVLDPEDKIGAAAIVLLQNHFHSVPVVNENRKLVGLLTTFDLLKFQYQKEYPGDDFPFS